MPAQNGSSPAGPLSGVVVIDLTRFQLGASATRMMGDLGADIVKIEAPSGDPGRRMLVHEDGFSSSFESLNRNKRSLAIDLRRPEGAEIVRRLVVDADVVTENFRPGTMERFGLGFKGLAAVNPRLIYGSGSTFGPEGARAGDPGYDHIGQASSGWLRATTRPGERPRLPQAALADTVGGLMLFQAILAALFWRERNGGRGQRVDISLLGSMIALQGRNFATATYKKPVLPHIVASGSVSILAPAQDGVWIMFGMLEDKGLPDLVDALDRPDLLNDHRFATRQARGENEKALVDVIEAEVAGRPAAEWIERLRAAGVACTLVNDFDGVATDPQAQANDYVVSYQHPTYGTLTAAGYPARFSATEWSLRRPAPLVPGEHSEEVLQEFGFTDAEIVELVATGVVSAPRAAPAQHG